MIIREASDMFDDIWIVCPECECDFEYIYGPCPKCGWEYHIYQNKLRKKDNK